MRWSVPLSALSTLGTRGAAGVLVVGVDAEPGLDHHHTVVMFVPAVFIWKNRKGAGGGGWGRGESGEGETHLSRQWCRTPNLMAADRREPRCRSAPAPVWCRRHSRSCAFCPPSGTVLPSSVGLCRKTGSTGNTSGRASVMGHMLSA